MNDAIGPGSVPSHDVVPRGLIKSFSWTSAKSSFFQYRRSDRTATSPHVKSRSCRTRGTRMASSGRVMLVPSSVKF
jgi:hypothetical protein